MNFKFFETNTTIDNLSVKGRSCSGVIQLNYPLRGGNYFSLRYENNPNVNIMNMSYENFIYIKENKLVENVSLIEIKREDDTTTNGFLIYFPELSDEWYNSNLTRYDTNILYSDNIDEFTPLLDFLKDIKLKINGTNVNVLYKNETYSHKKEDIEPLLTSHTALFYKNHIFNYLAEPNDLIKSFYDEVIQPYDDKTFKQNYKKYKISDDVNILFIETLSPMFVSTYTNYDCLYHYSKGSIDYFNNNVLGYSIFTKSTQTVEHFIVENDLLKDFLNKQNEYDTTVKKFDTLTKDGKDKFFKLLEKDKEEQRQLKLDGSSKSYNSFKGSFQKFLNTIDGISFIEYGNPTNLVVDINRLVSNLLEHRILKSDNAVYAEAHSGKNHTCCVYFLELEIIENISDNEFIARLSSNNNSFYFAKFIKNGDDWDFKPVSLKRKTVISYE